MWYQGLEFQHARARHHRLFTGKDPSSGWFYSQVAVKFGRLPILALADKTVELSTASKIEQSLS